jgi:DNA repair protein RadC
VELLALIVGAGGRSGSSLALAHDVLEHFSSLHELSQVPPAELQQVPGLGPARATALAAAFELGRRVARGPESVLERIEAPTDAVYALRPLLEGLRQEAVAALYLGARHQVLQARLIALGALNAAAVHPREVYRDAVSLGAAALVLGHNHPSGDPEPSEEDVRLTRRLRRCGETLGIELLDHVVLGDGRWVSLREQRLI